MEKLLKNIYKNKKLTRIFKLISDLAVFSSVLGFGILLYAAFSESAAVVFGVLVTLGAPFVAVTLIRRFINCKRPYEIYDFYEAKPKEKSGKSFPSRHAYSSFVISVLVCFIYPTAGSVLVFLSILMCFLRVLLGIHFIRDVLCGAFIGALSAILGNYIFALF